MQPFPSMPASFGELEGSVEGLAPQTLRHLATIIRESGAAFESLVEAAERVIGSVRWRWPVLDRWNEWCVANGVRFATWEPRPGGLDAGTRLAVLTHTLMTMGSEEANTQSYQDSGVVAGVEVLPPVLPRDECPVCALHAGKVVRLRGEAASALPPFHPGCRCITSPVLDEE